MSDTSDINALPPSWRPALAGATITAETAGQSGALVWRVTRLDGAQSIIKADDSGPFNRLAAEAERLSWLAAQGVPVPRVEQLAEHAGRCWLMMTAMAGRHAASAGFVAEQVVALFARVLAALHAIDVGQCPFDMRPAVRLADAEARFAAGHIEDDELDDDLVHGRGVRWLIDHLRAGMSNDVGDLVVTHGDACLENVIIAPDSTRVGLIDVGRAGVANRAQDLALAVRSVRDRYGSHGEGLFWAAYGAVPPSPAVMTYYELLEELG